MAERAEPSAVAIAVGTAILAGVTGFFMGQASSIGIFGASGNQRQVKPSESDSEEDADDDDEDLTDKQLLRTANSNEECKLVLVVRTDLGMGKGKSSLLDPSSPVHIHLATQ